jgi:hypothetical protein
MMNNTEKLSSIRIKLDHVEREIKLLEDLLIETSGPAEQSIAELKMLKEVQSFYRTQYNNALKEHKDDTSRGR